MMKKILSLLMVLLLSTSLVACNTKTNSKTSASLKVITTIFPQYDFTRNIGKELVDVKMLLKPGAESHTYEPTPKDIKDISESDLFIYVGGENDEWVERILESLDKKPLTLKLTDLVKTVEEEIVEGMQHSHDHAHDDHNHHHEKVKKEDVKDRALTDFEGTWGSIDRFFNDEKFNVVYETFAKEDNDTVENVKKDMLESYHSDFPVLKVSGDEIALVDNGNEVSKAKYEAKGFEYVEKNDHVIVWYKYERSEDNDKLPKYVVINDHATEPYKLEEDHGHMHLAFSNESFEKAIKSGAYPFYIAATKTIDDVLALFSDEDDHDHHHHVIDEHVWTSPLNAIEISEAIKDALVKLDEKHKDQYESNFNAYKAELKTLDENIEKAVKESKNDVLIFGDRFPFRYFVDRYNLGYYAAFSGCSTDIEPEPATIKFLIDKVNQMKAPVVFKIELSNGKIAESIANDTNAKILELNSVHNLTAEQIQNNESYISLMTKNIEALKEALN